MMVLAGGALGGHEDGALVSGICVFIKEAHRASGPFSAWGHGEEAKHAAAPQPSSALVSDSSAQNRVKSVFVPQVVQPWVFLLEQRVV